MTNLLFVSYSSNRVNVALPITQVQPAALVNKQSLLTIEVSSVCLAS
ncbi:Uncharacterised protein [Streptococcus pneumoniae]|nr:Uncharacterised protein [Streptococcus pneumoniae]CAG6327676.1 Uncharacterised protein [Streptococcus pneumoniae]